jgi:ADP-heptose:LPS heptosyltransferase
LSEPVEIIVSPFSNSIVRDWPPESYASLMRLLLDQLPFSMRMRVIGTESQALRADRIVSGLDASRVFNDCGAYSWSVVDGALRRAACVVGNNSGITHLSAYYGTPTVCVFGGSHPRHEWRPIGSNIRVISRAIWCSPCHLDRLDDCQFDKACLRDIRPDEVATAVIDLLDRPPSGKAASGTLDETSRQGPPAYLGS